MSPPSHPATGCGLNCQHLVACHELNQEPVAEDKDGRQFDSPKEENQEEERGNSGAGKADEVRAQHSRNRAARTNARQTRPRVEDNMQGCACEAGEEVKKQELEVAKAVFHAAPEDKKEKHVPEEMKPPSVQKHGDEDGNEKAAQGQVLEPMKTDVSRRDNSIEENQAVDAPALRQFEQEDQYVRDDERKSDGPEAPPPVVVGEGEGNHKKSSSNGKRQMANGKFKTI
jgi:hypothetical protein